MKNYLLLKKRVHIKKLIANKSYYFFRVLSKSGKKREFWTKLFLEKQPNVV